MTCRQRTKSITSVSESSRPNQSSLLICLLLALIAAALRIPSLASRGYSLDEAWTAEIASGHGSIHLNLPHNVIMPMPEFFNLGTKADVPWWRIWTKMECTHPPLYFLGLRFWTDVIGAGDAPERSFSILASLISVVLLYDVARLSNGRSIAIWSCILFVLAQPQIQYARETRNYTWLIACALMAADALVRIEKFGPTRRRLAALMIGVLATLLTHYFGIGMLVGLGLYAFSRTRGRTRLQILAAFGFAILVFAICWGPFMWQQRRLGFHIRSIDQLPPRQARRSSKMDVLSTGHAARRAARRTALKGRVVYLLPRAHSTLYPSAHRAAPPTRFADLDSLDARRHWCHRRPRFFARNPPPWPDSLHASRRPGRLRSHPRARLSAVAMASASRSRHRGSVLSLGASLCLSIGSRRSESHCSSGTIGRAAAGFIALHQHGQK